MSEKFILDLVAMALTGIFFIIVMIGFFSDDLVKIIKALRGDDDE